MLLDHELILSLLPRSTACTGIGAVVRALEAATNRRRHAANDLEAHRALPSIACALERAVRRPDAGLAL